MTIRWHTLPFTHIESDGSGCGQSATILEICVSSDGSICVSGVCIHCGEQFSSPEVAWATVMRTVSIKDYKQSLVEKPFTDFESMEPKGKPC